MSDPLSHWLPYCGAAPPPGDWLWHWNLDPFFIASLVALLGIGLRRSPATWKWQVGAAAIALILFVSPLCALGSALFTFRTVHHLAIALVLAPLLARVVVDLASRWQPSLISSTVAQAGVLWIWHAPPLYGAALSSDAIFWLMQLSLTTTAACWWIALRRASSLAAVGSVLATMVQMGVLGALLVFGGRPFYAPHWLTTGAWGLSPLEDQQIAGLIMWVLGSGAYLAIGLALLNRAFSPAVVLRRA